MFATAWYVYITTTPLLATLYNCLAQLMRPCACDCASVADKGMGDEAALSLSNALQHCSELEELDLSGALPVVFVQCEPRTLLSSPVATAITAHLRQQHL